MDQPFIALICMFGGNFAPKAWAFCWGQILSIAQNTALFSLLGTTYGGNGQTSFALPDLRGRMPIGWGNAPGLGNYDLGQLAGTTSTTLTINNMPAHSHGSDLTQLTSIPSASTAAGTAQIPDATLVPAVTPSVGSGPGATKINAYAAQDNTTTLAAGKVNGNLVILPAGGTQPFSIQNPYLAVSMIIALQGIYPSRN